MQFLLPYIKPYVKRKSKFRVCGNVNTEYSIDQKNRFLST